MMQDTITFPTVSSPPCRFTFSQSCLTDYSETCSPASTPFVSAPSSPGRCEGAFSFSAPTSPNWARAFLAGHDGNAREYPSSIPLHWDEDDGTSCCKSSSKDEAVSFLTASDFEFSARFTDINDPSMSPTPMSSANELFCNGQIRPLRISSSCTEHPSSSPNCSHAHGHGTYPKNIHGHASITHMNEHEVGDMPLAFEFSSRREFPATLQTSISAPQSPWFHGAYGCHDSAQGATSDLSKGKSPSFISVPQSPRSALNKVKGVLCGIPPSRVQRAFYIPTHGMDTASRYNAGISSRVDKGFSTSVPRLPRFSGQSVTDAMKERQGFSQTGRLASPFGPETHGLSHRRARSFSPLTIFQKNHHSPPCASSASSSCIRSLPAQPAEQGSTNCLPQEPFAPENQHDRDSACVQKGSLKNWTLRDLLHRKSGGENRRSSSRRGSHHSDASTDSVISIENMSRNSLRPGRSSSSESSSQYSASVHSFASAQICIDDYEMSSGRAKSVPLAGAHGSFHGDGHKRPTATQSHDDSPDSNGALRTSTMKGLRNRMQKGNSINIGKVDCRTKTKSQRGTTKQMSDKGCISPHVMHYMMHKQHTHDLRKKTSLPYRQELLGCLGFTSRSYRSVTTISTTLQSVSG